MNRGTTATIILTVGKSDNGKNATLAFSMGLSAAAMDQDTTIFLTGEGAVWGFERSAIGIVVQGFSPLEELIEEYLASGGRLLLCSICHKTCGTGHPPDDPLSPRREGTEVAGFTTLLELTGQGTCISL